MQRLQIFTEVPLFPTAAKRIADAQPDGVIAFSCDSGIKRQAQMSGNFHTNTRNEQSGCSFRAITPLDIIAGGNADSYTYEWRNRVPTEEIVVSEGRKR